MSLCCPFQHNFSGTNQNRICLNQGSAEILVFKWNDTVLALCECSYSVNGELEEEGDNICVCVCMYII